MTTFEMLQELLAQNEFELLLPEDHTANTTEQDIRLVYQMNDTVESFLVFREAIFTGTYKKDYEGKLDASYDRDQDRYVLGVRQGDSVITLFYQKLELEVNLYNYGEIAHFWVPRYENLRQLEFRIAVLWDKYTYLGENYCSEGEKHLVHLADVPALNFCSYCAAPEPYMVPHEIEAALDDSNVSRFASYLNKLTKNTQFIVITHRRGTMTAADRLYGITMQEKGVSTLVSVDLIEHDLN